jgi:hypothetical protein
VSHSNVYFLYEQEDFSEERRLSPSAIIQVPMVYILGCRKHSQGWVVPDAKLIEAGEVEDAGHVVGRDILVEGDANINPTGYL